MDINYDQKFEEMKKYIPFLEGMIKRLESSNSGCNNPRQAQLDKISSLRDLLLDKKKRMKMDNLIKCEQVLINLYAKMKQSPIDGKDCTDQAKVEKSNLNIVRNKLKSVVLKLQDDPETLPEIARATNTEVVCTPGSKEPALFQRRPNKASLSPPRQLSSGRCDESSSGRQYTRVLLSPEPKRKEWKKNEDSNTEKPLFSRRSPRRSPRRYSPSYKKERKKSSKLRSKSSQQSKSSHRSKDLNITLNVPEESIGSLNTKDILSRIINCSDSDVDIDTLRGLRSQILGELKHTGARDDISDLILKSYKMNESCSKKNQEVEEGEISDSESEAIENIYGSLVVVNNDEDKSDSGKTSNDEKPRKIKICLVINSEKEITTSKKLNTSLDVTDFDVSTNEKSDSNVTSDKIDEKIVQEKSKTPKQNQMEKNTPASEINNKEVSKTENEHNTEHENEHNTTTVKSVNTNEIKKQDIESTPNTSKKSVQSSHEKGNVINENFKPNFYKPCAENKAKPEEPNSLQISSKSSDGDIKTKNDPVNNSVKTAKKRKTRQVIKELSEIDILQALKNEILSETVSISEAATPPLHQPKILKVASAQEIVSKKRISIEKYKQKSIPTAKTSLFQGTKQQISTKDDISKKQSLKLTEKECERFNFSVNVSPVSPESSNDEDLSSVDLKLFQTDPVSKSCSIKDHDKSSSAIEFPSANTGPKSPDHEDFADTGIRPPVIIPSDPVKNFVASTKADVDMRTLITSKNPITNVIKGSPLANYENIVEPSRGEKIDNEKTQKSLQEYTITPESSKTDSPNSHMVNSDRISGQGITPTVTSNIPQLMSLNLNHIPAASPSISPSMNQMMTPILCQKIPLLMSPVHVLAPNMTPNMNPLMTPSMTPTRNPNRTPSRMVPSMNPMMTPILTPNARSYEMTPRQNFENDELAPQKHVYAPIFPTFEPQDYLDKDNQRNIKQRHHWEINESSQLEDRNLRNTSVQRDNDYQRSRNDRFQGYSYKHFDNSQTRMDCPSTPNPSFGRMECPPTPIPSFGRQECPSTPNPSFGRMECPPTPNASFGRMECPPTPNPSLGRMETHLNPSHLFGLSESSVMAANPLGRGDYHNNTSSYNRKYMKSQDPRLNRSSDYENYSRVEELNNPYYNGDHHKSDGKYSRYHDKAYDQGNRNEKQSMSRHESIAGNTKCFNRWDCDTDEFYNNDSHNRRDKLRDYDNISRNNRSRSIGREYQSDRSYSPSFNKLKEGKVNRDGLLEKPISVQSDTGRSFNIDTSFNRTFQERTFSDNMPFDIRRQRAASVGRSLHQDDLNKKNTSKHIFALAIPDQRVAKNNFRRACSVGRDLKDYNDNKNFKDIKDDLRSYKFYNYEAKFCKRDPKSETIFGNLKEKARTSEYQNRRDKRLNSDVYSRSNEYHNRRDFRDPRRRPRDYDSKIDDKFDSGKYSPRKNIRDPRMRHEKYDKTSRRDKYNEKSMNTSRKNFGIVYSNDNIAKGTILASAAGVKNFKIPKIKRPVEENQDGDKSSESDAPVKNESTGDTKIEQVKNTENKAPKLDLISKEKQCDKESSKNTIAKSDNSKINEVLSKKTDILNSQDDDTDSVKSIFENCDRRITRSLVKQSISPIKKMRRIKKPLIYDSDSDLEDKISDANIKESVEDKLNDATELTDSQIKSNDTDQKAEIERHKKQDVHAENIEPVNSANEKQNIIGTKIAKSSVTIAQKKTRSVGSEQYEEQNDSLDISFGVDDDLLSDNMASGSVLDNINALIANLDHDIEAPKINDFNDKFINNLVGSVSSNNSSIPPVSNEPDFSSDITLSENLGFVVEANSAVKTTFSNQINKTDTKDSPKKEITKVYDSEQKMQSCQTQVKQPSKIEEHKDTEMKSKLTEESNLKENDNNIIFKAQSTKCQEVVSNANNDDIDSTTETEGIVQKPFIFSENISTDCIPPSDSFSAPDSTINSNEAKIITNNQDHEESFPDSTNELTSEMNSDITSTHVSVEVTSKEQSEKNTASPEELPRIDSIEKLLSILQDKNKIKELLTMLGKDSGDNEKIKKKLEKLSEIVSDDEENTSKNPKDTSVQKEDIPVNDGQKNNNVQLVDLSHSETFNNENNKPNLSIKSSEESSPIKATHKDSFELCMDLLIKSTENTDKSEEFKKKDSVGNVKDLSKNLIPENKLKIDNEKCVEYINKDGVENNAVQKTAYEAENETIEKKEVEENILPKFPAESNSKDDSLVPEISAELPTTLQMVPKKKIVKPITRKGKFKRTKKFVKEKLVKIDESKQVAPAKKKKPSRELLKLQEDIREMFISEDILNATGIRMCRLAKLGDGKNSKTNLQSNDAEPEPIVVLENIKSKISPEESQPVQKIGKKRGAKSKTSIQREPSVECESKEKPKQKPGPKSKTKRNDDNPYYFETDSIPESNKTVDSRDQNTNSDSDVSTKSFGSSELLVDLKKKSRRKRRSWKLGVIKKKNVKNKTVVKHTETDVTEVVEETMETKDKDIITKLPDLNCFTDKSYCFYKNLKIYMCRICGYRGNDMVPHFKKHHPHSEIPLSRLNSKTAKYAIEQCENMNLQAISKIQTPKYICRFCFKEFNNNGRHNTALETFFWHVVSVHTGEYKQLCSECLNETRCPFHLDIPPPPKNLKGQLFGYICGRCNFTQVSLENLKTHVIVRHDDEQTEVYSINLSDISKKALSYLIKKVNETSEESRVLRSTRSNQSLTEQSDDRSDVTESTDRISGLENSKENLIQEVSAYLAPKAVSKNKIQSKFVFENDDMSDNSNYSKNDEIIKSGIKLEHDDDTKEAHLSDAKENTPEPKVEALPELERFSEPERHPEPDPLPEPAPEEQHVENNLNECKNTELTPTIGGVLDYPHFKIKFSGTGSKEFVCCINGEHHYKTSLLISLKKHVQIKHSQKWDGYCFMCKLIVTTQGLHHFKDCLQHYVDKHMDNFPVFEEIPVNDPIPVETSTPHKDEPAIMPYINVRPLSELISSEQIENQEDSMPKIQSVVSLGGSAEPVLPEPQKVVVNHSYEPAQAEIMSKKHRVVLETMLNPDKLIQIFKCAGRFCSYTTDNAEEALVHASTHQRIGGENSLKCAYCDFDCAGNVIDLVMHVFKNYSHCSFSCSKCFYRAAVSQLVHAHIKRIHTEFNAEKVPVYSSTSAVVKDNSAEDMLSRDEAVLHYVCNNRDPDEGGICQFKSFVLTKFREHLQTKHSNDQDYSCNICNFSTTSLKLLAQHLKSHGLRIYQCCRCLFGADNESELLAHASEKHPLKQPKAYLRIITSKGGSSEVRVLPLAVLSKSLVQTTPVTPTVDKESPVKQAERSIDLEKLIGHTNLMIESMSTITNAATIELTNISVSDEVQLESQGQEPSRSEIGSEHSSISPATLTLLKDQQNTSKTPTPNMKIEPVSTPCSETQKSRREKSTTADPDVVCLDSDDDSSRQIIDLSGEEPAPVPAAASLPALPDARTTAKVPRDCLYTCAKCSQISKSEGMFKRHIGMSCYTDAADINCAHCNLVCSRSHIVDHYKSCHMENTLQFVCAYCGSTFASITGAKRHMQTTHNETSVVVKMKRTSSGQVQQMVAAEPKARPPKRKPSLEARGEPPAKLRKYGPQDADKLPINPILDELVYCALCEFSTKVRLNMVRHLQLHAEQQPVPRTAPVNPVPHLESNEKHFDKMVNLASSSIVRRQEKARDGTSAALHLSAEAAAVYPKYVPERHRYTCGAQGCSYISSNESMLKIHWETLHYGTNAYHCVHCPPHQHMDTSKPLTASRIIAHLKKHDARLYACASCTFYHQSRKMMDRHLKEVHPGRLVVVREDGVAPPPAPPPPPAAAPPSAPTMDLKPWQCGLCSFKSMLRPEVVEHCGKLHLSKMQFKCNYCGFRTSNIENISKHQSKQHPGKKEEVFYFYYREGSIPDEADGSARWQRQSQKNDPEIKTETDVPVPSLVPILPAIAKPPPATPPAVDLAIVKQEVVEDPNVPVKDSVEDLCKSFGQFCEPNGLKYKCPLCKVVTDDSRDAMLSHLYEELQYRKWGCAVCSYKAFHRQGLQQHVQAEHGRVRDRSPVRLQVDSRAEVWCAALLDRQASAIDRNRENLAKQKAEILRANPGQAKTPAGQPSPSEPPSDKPAVSMAELERLFGKFGVPSNLNYSCPKCSICARSEAVMQEHLEGELNKIRWCCSVCNDSFQTYHEAQFHCRSQHMGQSARPVEATRDSALRAAWVAAVLRVQKLSMNYMPVTTEPIPETPTQDNPENSLLVVRYEENVPLPDRQVGVRVSDSEEDRLVIDEPDKIKPGHLKCPHCDATFKTDRFYELHVLKHYGVKPFTCSYCPYMDSRKRMEIHIKTDHPGQSIVYKHTEVPSTPLIFDHLAGPTKSVPAGDDDGKIICLVCEVAMPREESLTHMHNNMKPHFGIKGMVVYKCSICMTLHKTSNNLKVHNKRCHPAQKSTTFYKLQDETRSLWCNICSMNFNILATYRIHHMAHHGLTCHPSWQASDLDTVDIDENDARGLKRKAEDSPALIGPKCVAKKSTTKLPITVAVAKKSTTKLPFDAPCDSEEYSYYGTTPSTENLGNVTTLMPFCNTLVPFSLSKLNEIIKIYPVVRVKDINKK